MSRIIKIGMDPEFMAYKGKNPIYPALTPEMTCGCDEFGHCVEVRPQEAETKEQLLFNVMKEMSKLPKGYKYTPANAHILDADAFNQLMRVQQRKDVPTCENIYGKDILEDCALERRLRGDGKRLLFCGMHVHMSITERHAVYVEDKDEGVYQDVDIHPPIPARIITRLLDEYLFKSFNDEEFHVGRYRSPGFFEMKGNHWFEYRSLGSSAFTPKRVSIIFDVVKFILENIDEIAVKYMGGVFDMKQPDTEYKFLVEKRQELLKTKETSRDLKRLWVNWL